MYYAIWDRLRTTMEKTYFPVTVFFNDDIVDTIDGECFEELNDCAENERYMFRILPDYGMELWDKQTCTKAYIILGDTYNEMGNHCFFKGMKIENTAVALRFKWNEIFLNVDFYGLDAKETLSIDRKGIKKEAMDGVWEIINSAIDFYLAEIEEPLLMEKENRNDRENDQIYVYWCMLPLKKKIKLLEKYGKTFQKVERTIDILVRGTDNQFSVQPYDFKKVMAALNQIWIVHNLDVYIEYEYDGERMDIDSIEQLLNKNNVSFSMVLVDEKFIDILGCCFWKEIMVIPEGRGLYLGIPAIDEKELPVVSDEGTRQYLIKNLLRKRRSRTAYMFSGISTRQYTIGIRGYEAICTTQVPLGTGGVRYSDMRYIISPITIKQWDNNKHLEEDKFVEVICSCKEFSNLLDYVYEHQLEAGKYSKQKIKESYESFIREMYRIMKEDEVNNEHEKNDHSLP